MLLDFNLQEEYMTYNRVLANKAFSFHSLTL